MLSKFALCIPIRRELKTINGVDNVTGIFTTPNRKELVHLNLWVDIDVE